MWFRQRFSLAAVMTAVLFAALMLIPKDNAVLQRYVVFNGMKYLDVYKGI